MLFIFFSKNSSLSFDTANLSSFAVDLFKFKYCPNNVAKSPVDVFVRSDLSVEIFSQQFKWVEIRRLGRSIRIH